MKIKEINRTAVLAWSSDVIPLLAVGSVAGAVDLDFSSSALLEIWHVFGDNKPLFANTVDHKFYALAWSQPFGDHPQGVLVAALETGVLHFYDAAALLSGQGLATATFHVGQKHLGAVKCMLFNPHQPHVLATGGQHGEIYIWDLKTLAEPTTPGRPITPMDEISLVAWNNAVAHILASTSNAGYTSIWDLKLKREVLHLSYTGALGRADFSCVAWHPSQLTKLVTASQSDACPLIMLWDLRNALEPETILHGLAKGVLALDWCLQDPDLLLSLGKDNVTRLWNPTSGIKLGEYPTATNWVFAARFAPRAPDVFATASFDGKVVVQTLQDTSPSVSEIVKSTDDDLFWLSIAATDTQKASFEVHQAPQWYKRPSSVSFGFGSKIVQVKNSQGKGVVLVSKYVPQSIAHGFASQLSEAIKADDFTTILSSRLDGPDAADWQALNDLKQHGKSHFFQTIVEDSALTEDAASVVLDDDLDLEAEEDFFSNLSKDIKSHKELASAIYVPSGEFTIITDSHTPLESRLAKLILSNRIGEAVALCLKEGRTTEALALALDQPESVKNSVRNHYFQNTSSDVISRLIYSASSNNVLDIVSNADISNWKEIALSILAYCKEELEFNSRIVELGDRLMAKGASAKDNRNNALLCYLAGNALDKVASIWLSELGELEQSLLTSPEGLVYTPYEAHYMALTGFVEKISAYRSLVNMTGALNGPAIDPVCKAVFEFASTAAASGLLELADQFMALLPEDFAGLRSEKDRIAKASGVRPGPAAQNVDSRRRLSLTNGANKAASRYGRGASANTSMLQPAMNHGVGSASVLPPQRMSIPRTASPANVSQTYPYMPMAAPVAQAAPAFNPYMPTDATKRGSTGNLAPPPHGGPHMHSATPQASKPVTLIAPTGALRPPSTPAMIQRAASHLALPNSHLSPSVTAQASVAQPYKGTDGWNDLPDSFKAPKPAARRPAAPAAVQVPEVSELPKHVPPQPLRPIQASHAVPPPPKVVSRVSSKPTIEPPKAVCSPKSKKYAPLAQNDVALMASPVQPPAKHTPPKNPYAIEAAPTPKMTYAAPPTNNFVAPPPQLSSNPLHQHNPYSPLIPATTMKRGASGPPLAGSSKQNIATQPPMGKPIRSDTPPRHASPAQRAVSSRSYMPGVANGASGVQAHAGPKGTSLPLNGAPPSAYAPPPPPASGNVAPSAYNQGGHVPPPPMAKPPTSHGSPAMAPPPRASVSMVQPPAQVPPSPRVPPSHVNGASAPPPATLSYAPPPQAFTQPAVRTPVPQAVAPPPAAQAVAPPPMAQVLAPPPAQAAAPPAQAVAPPPVAAPAPAPAAAEPAVGSDASSKDGEFIESSFGAVLGHIKPAAPPKYAKHVADMEKRLSILFGHLKKNEVLSAGSIDLLKQVAASLNAKDYTAAASLGQQIGEQYPVEAGTWHTGVKRLVTMAEAFDV